MAAPDFLFRIHAADDTYLGTGVLVSPTHILTCEHVLRSNLQVAARRGTQSFAATVIDTSPEDAQDLALLKVDEILGDPPPWRHYVSDKAPVWLLGFKKINQTTGESSKRLDSIQSPDETDGWMTSTYVQSGAEPGMSGGIARETAGPECLVGLIRFGGLTAHRTILTGPRNIARFLAPHGLALPGCPQHFPIADIDHDAPMRQTHRERVRQQNSKLELKGFQGTNAHVAFPIQDFYVPLSAGTANNDDPQPSATTEPELLKKTNQNHQSLDQVFRQSKCLVVEGLAGSDKSTFLKHLAWTLAGESDRFPLLIKVVELDATIDGLLGRHPKVWQPSDPRWLAVHAAGRAGEPQQAFIERQLARPGAVVMLDGFDEALDETRRARLRELLRLAQEDYPVCRFVLTSRPGVYGGTRTVPGFHTDSIRALSKEDREVFFRNWCHCAYKEDPEEGQERRRDLTDQVEGNDDIREMAGSPMMLTALAVIHWNKGRLPEDRAKVYGSIIQWMLDARLLHGGTLSTDRRLSLLRLLAFGMQTWPEGRLQRAERGIALELLAPPLSRMDANHFLDQEEPDSGIIVGLADGHVQFRHLTLQEYLAADDLWQNTQDEQDKILQDPRRYGQAWREFLNLFAMLPQRENAVQRIYTKLLEAAQHESLANQARTVSLIRGMVRHRRDDERNIASPLYMDFLHSMSGLFEGLADGDNLDPPTRADAAEAWELLVGDTSRLLLPSDHEYWEAIADGQGIGRCPVTVHEYSHYLKARPDATIPEEWETQKLFPHRPVVRVSFHDASAYCQWWSDATEKAIRLPDEHEWYKGAAGIVAPRREYPWGSQDPDYDRANCDWKIRRPTPVGLFPKGAVKDTRIMDMAGNVWEWTKSQWSERSEAKVVRGGSFFSLAGDLRAAFRLYEPVARYFDLGFRCLRKVFP